VEPPVLYPAGAVISNLAVEPPKCAPDSVVLNLAPLVPTSTSSAPLAVEPVERADSDRQQTVTHGSPVPSAASASRQQTVAHGSRVPSAASASRQQTEGNGGSDERAHRHQTGKKKGRRITARQLAWGLTGDLFRRRGRS